MAGLGPVPLAGLMLAEMGATVLRIEPMGQKRPLLKLDPAFDLDRHGRQIIRLDLKRAEGVALFLDMVAAADVLLEGFRPGVMERLGLGPDRLRERNPRLIFGRMTGFGQSGPLARRAGHDLTYLAYTGVLNAIGHAGERPVPPLNLIGDYGGGTMFLIAGVLAAIIERATSGKGQIVDAAMVDGASMLAATLFGYRAQGIWSTNRGANLLDSGCPFYDTYETSDRKFIAVACLEPQFFAEFAQLLPLDPAYLAKQYDRDCWPDMRDDIAAQVRQKTRAHWTALFEPTDACVAGVFDFDEAAQHPHNVTRGLHTKIGDLRRPAPAPRFSRTQGHASGYNPSAPDAALRDFGLSEDAVRQGLALGIVD